MRRDRIPPPRIRLLNEVGYVCLHLYMWVCVSERVSICFRFVWEEPSGVVKLSKASSKKLRNKLKKIREISAGGGARENDTETEPDSDLDSDSEEPDNTNTSSTPQSSQQNTNPSSSNKRTNNINNNSNNNNGGDVVMPDVVPTLLSENNYNNNNNNLPSSPIYASVPSNINNDIPDNNHTNTNNNNLSTSTIVSPGGYEIIMDTMTTNNELPDTPNTTNTIKSTPPPITTFPDAGSAPPHATHQTPSPPSIPGSADIDISLTPTSPTSLIPAIAQPLPVLLTKDAPSPNHTTTYYSGEPNNSLILSNGTSDKESQSVITDSSDGVSSDNNSNNSNSGDNVNPNKRSKKRSRR